MRRRIATCIVSLLCAGQALGAAEASAPPVREDWLVNPAPYKAQVRADAARHELVLENGLTRRTLRLAPNAATVDYRNLVSGEQLLRATGPEAVVTIDGVAYQIGGLEGQPVQNFLKAEWIDQLQDNRNPATYRFTTWSEEPLAARFPWKKRPEWLAKDHPWPAPGRQVTLHFAPPSQVAVVEGKPLFEEAFGGHCDAAWKIHVSGRHPRSSFSNEGKHGEIYTPPDTAVYAERPWPAGTATIEVVVDAGDDTYANAWGPGLALVAPDRVIAFVIRPNQGCYDINGQPQEARFDRAKPVHLRIRLDKATALCEASPDGRSYTLVGATDCPQTPTALRVGKVGKAGRAEDQPGASPGDPTRCHVWSVTARAAGAAGPQQARTDLPAIDVHYAIYDGIPLLEKWLTIRNTGNRTVRVNKTVVETLKAAENECTVEPNVNWEQPSLYVESDYTYCAMNGKGANQFTVRWLPDRSYKTQVNYELQIPCLLEVAPQFGPEADLPAGRTLTSIRAFELFHDGSDRERRGLAQRRMYRTIAPWSQENPVMVHLISSKPEAIRAIIDQGAEVGVEMIILSFGSGMNLENADAKYQATYKELADHARSKGIVLGAYSLLASRGAANAADNCGGPGARVRFGTMPCLGSTWGQGYLEQLKSFMTNTGFAILEHDGSYPADTCARTTHPGHRDLGDSQWAQWTAITSFYQWCRANGVYLNVPDWYFLNGSSKIAMGYRETNWSLPRNEQEIIERQNVFDGTWEKTPSMGWMFVPLTQYHGGGAAATIEPLDEHLDHYEARLSNLFGAGVQACYRGPRIYDTDRTRAMVAKWIAFYKQHREVLDADILHLRRPDGRDWDGFVHVNPQGREPALAFFYNPLPEAIEREIRVPLHYAGLTGKVGISREGGAAEVAPLDRSDTVTLTVRIPAHGRTWVGFSARE